MAKSFARWIQDWLYQCADIRDGLAHEGPKILERLTKTKSLRQVAKESALSPTYLSLVRNGKAIISPSAYLELHELEK